MADSVDSMVDSSAASMAVQKVDLVDSMVAKLVGLKAVQKVGSAG